MRILLVTLFYPPLQSIASLRTAPMVDYLRSKGHVVEVITRYYDAADLRSTQNMVSVNDTHEISAPVWFQHGVLALPFKSGNPKMSVYQALPSPFNGLYNYLNPDIFHADFIQNAVIAFDQHLAGNRYDLILASFGPAAVIEIARTISKKYRIPYVIDFRDAFITEKQTGLKLFIMKRMQKHLMSASAGFIFASEGMQSFFAKTSPSLYKRKPSVVVYNGASSICFQDSIQFNPTDSDVVESFEQVARNFDLVFLHTGTVYAGQNINFFTDTLQAISDIRIAIVFVGLNDIPASFEASERIFMFRKVSHETSVYLQRRAHALLLPVYADRYTGWSGKTFEYLASGNLVLCSPGPQADLMPFFDACPNVLIMNDSNHLVDTVHQIRSGEIQRTQWVSEILSKEYWLDKLNLFIQNLS